MAISWSSLEPRLQVRLEAEARAVGRLEGGLTGDREPFAALRRSAASPRSSLRWWPVDFNAGPGSLPAQTLGYCV